jgi:hypothetical protein
MILSKSQVDSFNYYIQTLLKTKRTEKEYDAPAAMSHHSMTARNNRVLEKRRLNVEMPSSIIVIRVFNLKIVPLKKEEV